MKDLRKRCENLCFDLGGPTSMCPLLHGPYVDKLESFAREIQNETLEEAAEITGRRCGTSTIAIKEILNLKQSS